MMTRRHAIKSTVLAGAALATMTSVHAQTATAPSSGPSVAGPFKLPPLPYAYDALEPYIDAQTMRIHHDKHHAAYVANLNKALADHPDLHSKSLEELLQDLDAIPEKIRTAVRNNGGGDYNHTLFWQLLKKDGGEPKGALAAAMDKTFGSFNAFKEKWTKAALGQFGSGWAWLVMDGDKKLAIAPSANQDSPISHSQHPLLGIDVWEHAYYLKYQNRRSDYVAAFFHVINWDFVAERYEKLRA